MAVGVVPAAAAIAAEFGVAAATGPVVVAATGVGMVGYGVYKGVGFVRDYLRDIEQGRAYVANSSGEEITVLAYNRLDSAQLLTAAQVVVPPGEQREVQAVEGNFRGAKETTSFHVHIRNSKGKCVTTGYGISVEAGKEYCWDGADLRSSGPSNLPSGEAADQPGKEPSDAPTNEPAGQPNGDHPCNEPPKAPSTEAEQPSKEEEAPKQ